MWHMENERKSMEEEMKRIVNERKSMEEEKKKRGNENKNMWMDVTFQRICNFHDVIFHIYFIFSNFNLIISPFYIFTALRCMTSNFH